MPGCCWDAGPASTSSEVSTCLLTSHVGLDYHRAAGGFEGDRHVGVEALAQGQHGPEVLQIEGHICWLGPSMLVVQEQLHPGGNSATHELLSCSADRTVSGRD